MNMTLLKNEFDCLFQLYSMDKDRVKACKSYLYIKKSRWKLKIWKKILEVRP